MRAFFAIFITIWFLNLFLPWWSLLFPALIFGAWLAEGSKSAFLAGFLGSGAAWFVQALFTDIMNSQILSGRIAEMMQVGSPVLVLALTFLIGALPGGLFSLLGWQLKTVLSPSQRTETN